MQNRETTTRIYVDTDRLRVEAGGEEQNMVIIFRQDKDLFWVVDKDEQEYREMTREDLKKMKMQIEEGMKKMQEQMKNLPPEQRKMMESMMPANINVKKMEKYDYTKVESGVKVADWTCTHYIGKAGGVKKQEIWSTDWSQINITADDMKTFRDMGEFFQSLAPDMPDMFRMGDKEFEKQGGFAGMPVKTVTYEDGNVTSEFQIRQITQKDLNKDLFEVPGNYEKVENDMQGMQ
jgi:hypothetical protein